MKKLNILLLILMVVSAITAQQKPDINAYQERKGKTISVNKIQKLNQHYLSLPAKKPVFEEGFVPKTFDSRMLFQADVSIKSTDLNNIPNHIMSRALTSSTSRSADSESYIYEILEETVTPYLGGESVYDVFVPIHYNTDELNIEHIRYQQHCSGIPVFAAEYYAHIYPTGSVIINGNIKQLPVEKTVELNLDAETAADIVRQDLLSRGINVTTLSSEWIDLMGRDQYVSELCWYSKDNASDLSLCYHISAMPNFADKLEYFVDAGDGSIVDYFSGRSSINGYIPPHIKELIDLESADENNGNESGNWFFNPTTAIATDLFGVNRTINTFQHGGQFIMADASRPMYVQGSIPNNVKGALLTMNCNGTSPFGNSFNPLNVTSNNNTWSNRNSVSTHYHTMLTYDFFKNVLNINSYDNKGANMISFFDLPDDNGQPYDNAFWSQRFSFFGAGKTLFIRPLSAALDVVAHEFGHGLVQETAGLIYKDEPGALNEMYADLCGLLVNGNNWKMATAVVNTNFFPTGAMRDLSNPANGGTSLNDQGYQPGHVSQQYRGTQDYGGVHINSSIPGNAMYRFTQRTSIDIMRNVAFRALTNYLTKSAQFVDYRIAAIQSAIDLYGEGATVNALRQSFDEVGIVSGSGGNPDPILDPNLGDDFVMVVDAGADLLFLADASGEDLVYPIATVKPISRPSITDDGSAAAYIGVDKRMHVITMDFQSGQINTFILQNEPIWRNVAVSKDGTLLAALTDELNNQIYVYSFGKEEWKVFELFGVSTAPGAPLLDNVFFADAMEWSYDGSVLMYDALNSVNINQNSWDIGYLFAWDNQRNDFGDGAIVKMFEGLDPSVSIGNPTFSKNSPNIIAFDYLDEDNNMILFGMNLERSEIEIIFENQVLSYPSYSREDSHLIFDARSTQGAKVVAIQQLGSNKISPVGNPAIFINNAYWGVWFANGERDLNVATKEHQTNTEKIHVFPNPAGDFFQIQFADASVINQYKELHIVDIYGKPVQAQMLNGAQSADMIRVDIHGLVPGTYMIKLLGDTGAIVQTFIKL